MRKKTNSEMNNEYPCVIIKRYEKKEEYGDLYVAAALLQRPIKAIYEALEAYNGQWRTVAFEVCVEDEVSRMRRLKQRT